MGAKVTLNDRYTLEDRPFAYGGMGEIWRATDNRFERTVVVKMVKLPGDDSDDERIRRFVREAKLTAKLDHPGVPAVYDMGRHEDRPYLVMQLVQGIDVDDLIAECSPLPISWAACIGAQVCSVLSAAHAGGLIHRDIKPDNLMLDHSGSVKVLDFGLAAILGDSEASRITRTGELLGTTPYMAPEQVIGTEVTAKTDIYGLGCTLYDLLTGRTPFTGETNFGIMRMHVDAPPQRLRELRGEVPQALDDLVHSMLEKRPEDRPPSAGAVHDALLPFVVDMPSLPGIVTTSTDPIRAYAALSSRLPVATSVAMDRSGLAVIRDEAMDLLNARQFDEAAQVLETAIGIAAETFGRTDDAVVSLRDMHAKALREAGRLRAAARQHRVLARDLAEHHGADHAAVLEHREQAAHIHILLDEHERARTQLDGLLEDLLRVHGPDHPAVHDLRRRLASLREVTD